MEIRELHWLAFRAAKKHPLIIYMEPGCTPERIQIMKAYGTDVRGIMEIPGAEEILKNYGFDPVRLMQSVSEFAKEQDYYYVAQLFNENNPGAHYKTTGPELVEDTDGKIDIAVMLAGTAGTLAGVGSYLQDHVPGVQIVGVQPTADSLSFVPDAKATIDGVVRFDKPEGCTHPFVVRRNFKYDEVIDVQGEDAYATARRSSCIRRCIPGRICGSSAYRSERTRTQTGERRKEYRSHSGRQRNEVSFN